MVLQKWETDIQRVISSRLHPWIWDPVTTGAMGLPFWIVLGALGLLFLLVARRRAPTIGYSSRP